MQNNSPSTPQTPQQPNINPMPTQNPASSSAVNPVAPPSVQPSMPPQTTSQPTQQSVNQQIVPPNSDSKKPRGSKLFLYILIAVVILVLLAVGVFAYMKYSSSSGQSQSVSIDDSPLLSQPAEVLETTPTPSPTTQADMMDSFDGANELKGDTECAQFPDMLESCTAYKCTFTHPFTSEKMKKEIIGLSDGKCVYSEQMPNSGQMNCNYNQETRIAAAQYYRDIAAADSTGVNVSGTLDEEVTTSAKYTINGVEVDNPLDTAMSDGQCEIVGY